MNTELPTLQTVSLPDVPDGDCSVVCATGDDIALPRL